MLSCTVIRNAKVRTRYAGIIRINGFANEHFYIGGENIRPFWNRYYNRVQAVIFVIDGLCTHVELEETKAELFKALQTRQLRSIPWLILCNKQDLEGASTHEKVCLQYLFASFTVKQNIVM